MNEIFSNLSVSDKITTEVINENFSVELSGKIKMIRGSFSQERTYWCRLHKSKYGTFVTYDEIDGDELDCMLGNVKIDNLKNLKDMLTKSGLSTLSNSIGFTYEEFCGAAIEAMQQHSMLGIFGNDVRFWQLIPIEEQVKIRLQFVIANYDTNLVSKSEKQSFGIVVFDGDGEVVPDGIPTKEQFIEKLNNL